MNKSLRLLFLCLLPFTVVAQSTTSTPAVTDGTGYKLRPGDALTLGYRITPEYNQDVILGPDGHVSLYIAGDVALGGLTVQQAHDLIVERESARLNEPELSLVLKDFDKPYVVVAGEVYSPGKVLVRQQLTALQAVMLAGGFKETGKDSQVLVYRMLGTSDMARVYEINLHRLRKQNQLQQDLALMPGDMLMVPLNKVAIVQRYVRLNPLGLGYNFSGLF